MFGRRGTLEKTIRDRILHKLIDDMSAYASRIHTAYGLCDVLKFSDEDLDLLYPGIDPFEQLVTIQEGLDLL